MKKTGLFLMPLGLALMALGIWGIVKTESKDPLPYFVLTLGVTSFFMGLSFLFFHLPYEKRKKCAATLFIIGGFFVFLVLLFTKLHLPGASILAVCTGCFFSFTWLPLLTRNRVEKWKQFTRKKWHAVLLSIGDLVSLGALILGYLFKKMHWPGAELMMWIGISILAGSLLGWNRLFSKEIVLRKEAEDKVKEAFEKLRIQHELIDEKQKEILDSIHYAKRIQQSLLTNERYIHARLNKLQGRDNK